MGNSAFFCAWVIEKRLVRRAVGTMRKFVLLMFAPSARTGRLPRFFCRVGKAWMLSFYP
jgi:hypothetical protein